MPTAHTRVIAANEYRRERWRNGFGWTREIARIAIDAPHVELDAEDDAWDLRLSIAEIEQDAPFSLFPGIDRELVLLSGAGIVLDFDDAASIPVEPPHGRHAFAGERAVTARLIDGRTHDFNLMSRRAACEATLWHRPLVGPMVIFGDPCSVWCLHVMAGHARFGGQRMPVLEAGDSAILSAGGDRLRQALEGSGEVLLVRASPRSGGPDRDVAADALRI